MVNKKTKDTAEKKELIQKLVSSKKLIREAEKVITPEPETIIDKEKDTTEITKATFNKSSIIIIIAVIFGLILSGLFIITITKQTTTPTTYQQQKQSYEQNIAAKDVAVKIMRNDPLAPRDYDYYMANKESVDELVKKYKKAETEVNTLKQQEGVTK